MAATSLRFRLSHRLYKLVCSCLINEIFCAATLIARSRLLRKYFRLSTCQDVSLAALAGCERPILLFYVEIQWYQDVACGQLVMQEKIRFWLVRTSRTATVDTCPCYIKMFLLVVRGSKFAHGVMKGVVCFRSVHALVSGATPIAKCLLLHRRLELARVQDIIHGACACHRLQVLL
jgi:hypothetical protein